MKIIEVATIVDKNEKLKAKLDGCFSQRNKLNGENTIVLDIGYKVNEEYRWCSNKAIQAWFRQFKQEKYDAAIAEPEYISNRTFYTLLILPRRGYHKSDKNHGGRFFFIHEADRNALFKYLS